MTLDLARTGLEAHYAALGRVAAASALVENRMAVFLYVLIGSDQTVGQILVAELGSPARASLLSALGRHRMGEGQHYTELSAILKDAEKAMARRGKLIHSIWRDDLGEEGRRRIKVTARGKKGLEWDFEAVPAEDILRVARHLDMIADRLDDLLTRLPSKITGVLPKG